MSTKTISNCDDIIDSRDIIERISDLEDLRDNNIINDEESNELASLKTLQEEVKSFSSEWEYGVTLIHNNYFTEYAIDELGNLPKDHIVIDKEAIAYNIQEDYTSVEFNGSTYWILSS
jgi:hypothetical protein